jgi:hypothetical protein
MLSDALAVTDLRRAETFLLRGEQQTEAAQDANPDGSRDIEESVLAYLEDASSCLDRAHNSLDEERRKARVEAECKNNE